MCYELLLKEGLHLELKNQLRLQIVIPVKATAGMRQIPVTQPKVQSPWQL